ncbi:hypothetical protein C0993_001926 [Termitomyces sp. T159_Od127]|nr:hypothetical protein C0993_001926 [Termitomyces sp. T159_Od127]
MLVRATDLPPGIQIPPAQPWLSTSLVLLKQHPKDKTKFTNLLKEMGAVLSYPVYKRSRRGQSGLSRNYSIQEAKAAAQGGGWVAKRKAVQYPDLSEMLELERDTSIHGKMLSDDDEGSRSGSTLKGVLSCEPVEGFGDPRVVINELAVEIGKTKEGLHLFYTLWQRPVEDGLHLSRVHANTIWSDYDTKVLNFGGVEQALLQFGIAEVNFGVDFGAAETVNKVTNEGKRILVLFGDFVETPVVNEKA